MTVKNFLYVVFILSYTVVFSQSKIDSTEFSAIDSFAKTVKYKNDLRLLTSDLTKNYSSDLEKTRAIFFWITDNIEYDYKFVNHNKKVKFPKCKKGRDCNALFVAWQDKYLHKIIKSNKAICDDIRACLKKCAIMQVLRVQ